LAAAWATCSAPGRGWLISRTHPNHHQFFEARLRQFVVDQKSQSGVLLHGLHSHSPFPGKSSGRSEHLAKLFKKKNVSVPGRREGTRPKIPRTIGMDGKARALTGAGPFFQTGLTVRKFACPGEPERIPIRYVFNVVPGRGGGHLVAGLGGAEGGGGAAYAARTDA